MALYRYVGGGSSGNIELSNISMTVSATSPSDITWGNEFLEKLRIRNGKKVVVSYTANNNFGGLRLIDEDTNVSIATFASGTHTDVEIDISGHQNVKLYPIGNNNQLNLTCTITAIKIYT